MSKPGATFEGEVNKLKDKAGDPGISDYYYCTTMKPYSDDYPFQTVILQAVKNRFDNTVTIPKYISAKIKTSHTGKPRDKEANNALERIKKNYLFQIGLYPG